MTTIQALQQAPKDALPGIQDQEIAIPPVLKGWVRRVEGSNFWLVFTFDDEVVIVSQLLTSPPVPLG